MIKRNLRNRVSSRNSDRRLYESIMKDVAKTVKKHLNEGTNIFVENLISFKNFIVKYINNKKFINNYLNDNGLIKNNLIEEYNSINWSKIESIIDEFLNYLYNEFNFDNSNFNGSEMEILLTAICYNEYGEEPHYKWLSDDYPDSSRYLTYSAALMDIELEIEDLCKKFIDEIPNFLYCLIEDKIAYANIPESIK